MVIITGKKRRANKSRSRRSVYALNFIFSLHLGLVSYYMSTFLVARGFPGEFIGLLYAVGSIVTLVAIANAPYLLKKFGNYTNLLALGLLEILAFLGFAFVENLTFLFAIFLTAFIIPMLIAFSLDIFLEGSTKEEDTGGIRGIFLTIASIAWVAAPLLGGFLVVDDNFTLLFVVSAIIFIPFLFIAATQLKYFRDPKYIQLDLPKFSKTLLKNKNLRNTFITQFLLRFFYSTMVIYFPLYIHGTLNIPLSGLGIIIAVGTLAFIFLEIPLGKLEDSLWGEKEVLLLGFVVIAIASGLFSFVVTTSIAVWAGLAFLSRIGAAMIEISSEGYFFKHIDADDSDDVSAFRMLYPLAYILSPLLGTIFLLFFPMQFIFLAAGIIMATGVFFAACLKDTL